LKRPPSSIVTSNELPDRSSARPEQRDHRLRDRQIAGGRHRDHLVVGLEQMQFAERRDVVEPRIGPRIGHNQKAIAHQNADTIRHIIHSKAMYPRQRAKSGSAPARRPGTI
jgi:hypothetical protein